jgi:glycosyltransferase involved in cell wall biosynthesis
VKVYYDYQIFTIQRWGGISRYYYELMDYYSKSGGFDFELLLSRSNNGYLNKASFFSNRSMLNDVNFFGKRRILNIFNKSFARQKLKESNFDVFHPTYYDPYFLPFLKKKPFVIMIPDMIHEKFSSTFPSWDFSAKWKKELARKAAKIITITQNTKRDIMEMLGIPDSKIEVVYLGNSLNLSLRANTNIELPKKYVLFVGSRVGYKNFDKFTESVIPILKKDTGLNIVCVGDKFSTKEIATFDKLGVKNRFFQYSVHDEVLAQIYSKAEAFVFPSMYEGFGIPILESFACGCPAILSNCSSFPEVAEDAAIYFDPYSIEDMTSAIEKVVYNNEIKNNLIKKGNERIKTFSWDKAALETKKVYESVV